jgi:hypothetical protein
MKLRLSARAAKVRAATLTGMAARASRGLPAFWRALVRFLVRRGVQGRPDHHPPGALDASLCQEWMLNRGMKTPNCAQRTTQRQRDPPRHSRCWRPSLVFAAVLAGPQSDRSFGGLRRGFRGSPAGAKAAESRCRFRFKSSTSGRVTISSGSVDNRAALRVAFAAAFRQRRTVARASAFLLARGLTQAWRYRKLPALSFPLAQSAAAAPVPSASRK